MRQRLYNRLEQLERKSAHLRHVRDAADGKADLEKARRKVELFLRLRGVEQNGMESVMETWARALEIPPRALRAQLSDGIDPIHKYFTDHGIFEEIERRKAAGTWPCGGREGQKIRL